MRWLRSPEPTCSLRDCACSALCLAWASSSRRALSSDSARARFLCWLRSSWHSTTIPLGRWVMRIAESVLLTCWPPAPDARNVSTLRSPSLISISSMSASSGRIATVAAEVCMRPCASVSGTRCTRCVPDSYLSRENAPRAFDARDDFLVAAVLAGARRQEFDAPASPFGITQVHAQQVAREERGLVAAGARADLEEQIAFVARILWYQQAVEVLLERGEARFEIGDFRCCEVFHFRISQQRARRLECAGRGVVCAQRCRERGQMRMLARNFAQAFRVGQHFGTREQVLELLVALGELFEFVADAGLHGVRDSDRAGRMPQRTA